MRVKLLALLAVNLFLAGGAVVVLFADFSREEPVIEPKEGSAARSDDSVVAMAPMQPAIDSNQDELNAQAELIESMRSGFDSEESLQEFIRKAVASSPSHSLPETFVWPANLRRASGGNDNGAAPMPFGHSTQGPWDTGQAPPPIR